MGNGMIRISVDATPFLLQRFNGTAKRIAAPKGIKNKVIHGYHPFVPKYVTQQWVVLAFSSFFAIIKI